jgi:hypothetical protein
MSNSWETEGHQLTVGELVDALNKATVDSLLQNKVFLVVLYGPPTHEMRTFAAGGFRFDSGRFTLVGDDPEVAERMHAVQLMQRLNAFLQHRFCDRETEVIISVPSYQGIEAGPYRVRFLAFNKQLWGTVLIATAKENEWPPDWAVGVCGARDG